MRRLWAISDLHVGFAQNRRALESLADYGQDWLIVAGDVAEALPLVTATLAFLASRFERVIWVPGNHELWTPDGATGVEGLRGEARYHELVRRCRELGVLTPEDDWVRWPEDLSLVIAPCFVGYDYSFAPDGYTPEQAVAWAAEDGIRARDEDFLHFAPYPSRAAWCAARAALTEDRLAALPPGTRAVVIHHWPLRRDLIRLFRIPRYAPWCGTRRTEDWSARFPIAVIVSGHLHLRATDWRDGTRYEEVSLGYPAHWRFERGIAAYLRPIFPAPPDPDAPAAGPVWHR